MDKKNAGVKNSIITMGTAKEWYSSTKKEDIRSRPIKAANAGKEVTKTVITPKIMPVNRILLSPSTYNLPLKKFFIKNSLLYIRISLNAYPRASIS